MASSIGILPGRIKCWHANCRTSVDGCASFLVFANGIVRTTALTPSEPCSACDHAWYSHQLTSEDMTHQNSPHRRGGLIDSGCGGFYAPVEPGDWTFQTVCACGRALRSHEILNSLATVPTSTVIPTPISSDASGIPMTHGVSLFSNAFPVLGRQDSCSPNPPLVSAPPIEAYRGVRAAEPGRTIDRRNASAERARLALSSSLQNVARIRRQTQIPHSHPTAHISLLSANQSGPSSSAATSSQPDPSDASARRFCVLFVPHVPPSIPAGRSGYPDSSFRWPAAGFARLADVLQKVNLVFAVELPASGPAWRELGRQVAEHLQAKSIHFAGSSSSSPASPTDLPFIFLTAAPLRQNQFTRIYHPYDELDINTFTAANLTMKPFGTVRLPLADDLSTLPLLLIAPREHNLCSHLGRSSLSGLLPWADAAALTSRYSTHKCFSARVMHSVAPSILWNCVPDCPSTTALEPEPATLNVGEPSHPTSPLFLDSDSDDDFPSVAELARQEVYQHTPRLRQDTEPLNVVHSMASGSSSTSTVLSTSGSSTMGIQPASRSSSTPIVSDPTLPARSGIPSVRARSSSMELTATMHPSNRARVHPSSSEPAATGVEATSDSEDIQSLRQRDIDDWAGQVQRSLVYDVENIVSPSICAPDAQCAGKAMLFLVRWLFEAAYGLPRRSPADFQAALFAYVKREDVTCSLASLASVVAAGDNMDIQIGEGIGQATLRTTLRFALKLSLEDTDLWERRGDYTSILFSPSRDVIASRYVRLQACGFLALLHMLRLRTGPDPISPFLLRAAIEDRTRALSMDPPFLRRLAPEYYTTLTPWVERDLNMPPDMSPRSAIGILLYGANINPRGLPPTPSAEQIQGIELALVSDILLGDKDLSNHPDLEAFASGLNYVLRPGMCLDNSFQNQTRDYLAHMYDRRLKSAEVLITHLEFKSAIKSSQRDQIVFEEDGQEPLDDVTWDLINEDLFATRLRSYLLGSGHPNHPHIRELISEADFNAAASDSTFRVRAFLQMMSGSELMPADPDWRLKLYFRHIGSRTTMPEGEPPIPAPLGVHACFYEATVTVDEGLRNLLREERCEETNVALAFDAWVHGALMHPDEFSVA